MTWTMSGGIERLRAAMEGPVLQSSEAGCDDARAVWNGDIDRHPAVVARCQSPADVAAEQHPDLFWALRGGGGNFGVVTHFDFRLHPVGPEVHVGFFFWGADQGREGLRAARDAIPSLPEDTGILFAAATNAPPAPFVPEQHHFVPGHALIVAGFGSAEDHAHAIAPIRDGCPPLFEFVTPMPYTSLQQMLDESAPWGIRAYEKALYLDDLTDEAITVLVERAADRASPLSFAPIFRVDGAYSQVGVNDTAYGGSRTPQYVVNIAAISPDADALAGDRAWVRSVWDALRPLAGDAGGYVNFQTEPDQGRVRTSYGPAKYDRLARIKGEYDPDNVLHRNINIKPA